MELPVPASVPPHEPVYHFTTAPVPRVPPIIANTDDWPEVITAGVADAEVGAIEGVFTVTAKVLAVLFPQRLLAVMEMFPAEAPTVVAIVLFVELPDHPDGKVQVYEVAPLTLPMV